MRKIKINVFIIITSALVTLASSCKKDLREAQVSTETSDENLMETSSACSVVSITGTNGYGSFQKAVFSYDSFGNPTSMILNRTEDGLDNYQFRYDFQHRLLDLIGYTTPVLKKSFEIWHNYHYNSSGQINADTVYIWGTIGKDGQPKDYYDKYIVHFKYDSQGRIIKDQFFRYEYDSNGNIADGLTYDHKKNINRTNPIWQFLNSDYSVNNAQETLNYSHGYPGKVNDVLQFMETWWGPGTTTITYSCR